MLAYILIINSELKEVVLIAKAIELYANNEEEIRKKFPSYYDILLAKYKYASQWDRFICRGTVLLYHFLYHERLSFIDKLGKKIYPESKKELTEKRYDMCDQIKKQMALFKSIERVFSAQIGHLLQAIGTTFSDQTVITFATSVSSLSLEIYFALQLASNIALLIGGICSDHDTGFRRWTKIIFGILFLICAFFVWFNFCTNFFNLIAIISGLIKTALDFRFYLRKKHDCIFNLNAFSTTEQKKQLLKKKIEKYSHKIQNKQTTATISLLTTFAMLTVLLLPVISNCLTIIWGLYAFSVFFCIKTIQYCLKNSNDIDNNTRIFGGLLVTILMLMPLIVGSTHMLSWILLMLFATAGGLKYVYRSNNNDAPLLENNTNQNSFLPSLTLFAAILGFQLLFTGTFQIFAWICIAFSLLSTIKALSNCYYAQPPASNIEKSNDLNEKITHTNSTEKLHLIQATLPEAARRNQFFKTTLFLSLFKNQPRGNTTDRFLKI